VAADYEQAQERMLLRQSATTRPPISALLIARCDKNLWGNRLAFYGPDRISQTCASAGKAE
jgi:hypothetical protein